MKHVVLIVSAILLVTFNAFGQAQPPNVVLFIADDVSWDDFGCYGNAQVQTPNIDKLAANGLIFTNVYLTASSCSPSRNSIITGRYPHNTGAAELHTEPPLEMYSFPEVLRKHNYYSVQAGKFHMGEYAKRGFDVIYEKQDENGYGGEEKWLESVKERPRDKPFFMWFAAYDAHRTWGPNDFTGTHNPEKLTPPFYLVNGKGTRKDLADYYDEIRRFDHHIGVVVNELRAQEVLDNTLIIVMADNGRPFPHSKTRVNDRGMKTPFVVHWPGAIKKGAVCTSLVSAIDIAPTIMKLAGTETPDQFQGYSFDKLLTNPGEQFRNFVFAEHNWHDYEAHERMVRNKDFMYVLNSRPLLPQSGPADAVESPSYIDLEAAKDEGKLTAVQADVFVVPRPAEELYDYRRDPLQLLNIASVPEHEKDLSELRGVLEKWMKETGDNIPTDLTKDWYERLPGYVQTGQHSIRGEMPGNKLNATEINAKGAF